MINILILGLSYLIFIKLRSIEKKIIFLFSLFSLNTIILYFFPGYQYFKEGYLILLILNVFIKINKEITLPRYYKILWVLYFMNLAIVLFFSQGTYLDIFKDLRFYSIYPLLILIFHFQKLDLKYLFDRVIFIGILIILFGIIDKLIQNQITLLFTPKVNMLRSGIGLTAIGTLGNRVNFGFYSLFIFTLILIDKGIFNINGRKFILFLSISTLGMMLSYSKTAYFTSLILLSIFLFISKLKLKYILSIIIIMTIIFFFYYWKNYNIFYFLEINKTLSARTTLLWPTRLKEIAQNPMGYGFGIWGNYEKGVIDNSYFKLMLSLGIQGFVLLILIFIEIIKSIIFNKKWFYLLLLVMLFTYSITVDIFHIYFVMALVYILIGIMYNEKDDKNILRKRR